MTTSSTTINFLQTTRDGALILKLRGPLDSALALDALIEVALQSNARCVIVSFNDVDYINSSGFGALARMSELMTQNAKTIYMVGLQGKVRVVFDSLGARHLFNIFSDINDALVHIKNNASLKN